MSKPKPSKPRSIFEEVSTPADASPPPASAAASTRGRTPGRAVHDRRGIARWLSLLFLMVVAMILVGGLTRLTDSGLSITEWRPVTGALPPMDAAAWEAEFARYRETTQAEVMNPAMTLPEFRRIYWWEWGHRQLGRLIGLIWAAGFAWFALRRRIPPGWTPRLLSLGVLGGLQGAIGWWMVRSGLEAGMISVASVRLAVHLGIAFLILGLIAGYVLALRRSDAELLQARRQRSAALMSWGSVLLAVAFLQVILGALVAGIDAGRGFPEWPLMAGQVFPPDAFSETPAWRNFLDNPGLVQFNHRVVGYLLLVLGLAAWWRSRASALSSIRRAFLGVTHMLLLQVAIGIATVLYAAPLPLAILHQLGAVLLFALIVRARFTALHPAPERIARG